jgi:putative transcriptional regulator
MTITHHPSEETLSAFANASLCEGNSVVVATHLAHCGECRGLLRSINELAGELLTRSETSAISDASRAACIARLDTTVIDPEAPPAAISASTSAMAPVSIYGSGKWQWVGPGVYRRFVDIHDASGTRVFMLKAAPGTRLPDHRHVGTEWTCVLQGAFRHDHGRFGAGDFDEADSSVDHNPFVEEGEACICLVALNGHVEMTGWLGRLIQPLVRL